MSRRCKLCGFVTDDSGGEYGQMMWHLNDMHAGNLARYAYDTATEEVDR